MTTELLRQNLAIEPDVQTFLAFVQEAVERLGGNAFAAAVAAVRLADDLRGAGAGSGYPLPVAIELQGNALVVRWNGQVSRTISELKTSPPVSAISALRQYFQQSTEVQDPALLLRRNLEMARFLEESRAKAERELARLQETLERRQAELADTQRQAETDALTGLYNRRAYDARLAQAFIKAKQTGEAISLALCDLDHFKAINDEHGHQYGDDYLCRMAQAMRSVIRKDSDAAFRFGGDEFAILYQCGKEIALKRLLTLLAAMEGRISVGLAGLSKDEPWPGALADFIARADRALYEAKERGRGRVVVDTCLPDGRIVFSEYRLDPLRSETTPSLEVAVAAAPSAPGGEASVVPLREAHVKGASS